MNIISNVIGTIINDDSSGGQVEIPLTMWLGHEGGVTTPGNQIVYDGTTSGGWNSQAAFIRSANRHRYLEEFRSSTVGFRCAMDAPQMR